MNNKGIVAIVTLMIAVVIIILALSLAGPVKTTVDDTRANSTENSLGLNCTDSRISDFQNTACQSTDLIIPVFIGSLIGFAGVIVGARIVFSS